MANKDANKTTYKLTDTEQEDKAKEIKYAEMNKKLAALLSPDDKLVTTLSNACALLKEYLIDVNWIGFYIVEGDRLYLGPFQGKTACTVIRVGDGVCGAAVQMKEALIVGNVDFFPGHIACDRASRSEMVVPVFVGYKIAAVLDIDSGCLSRFNAVDKAAMVESARIIGEVWEKCGGSIL